jgi:hypothetical protein
MRAHLVAPLVKLHMEKAKPISERSAGFARAAPVMSKVPKPGFAQTATPEGW